LFSILTGGNVRSRSPMAKPSISLRTSAGRPSGYVSVIWRKAERTMLIRAKRVPVAFQAMPTPRSVSLPNGGAVRCRSPHVAVPLSFQNPLPSRRRPLQSVNGVPSEIRTPCLPLRKRTLCSNELRERSFGPRPGNRTRAVYGDLPLRAYKAQPHASAGAVELVRVA
jgi:hypothetical protein